MINMSGPVAEQGVEEEEDVDEDEEDVDEDEEEEEEGTDEVEDVKNSSTVIASSSGNNRQLLLALWTNCWRRWSSPSLPWTNNVVLSGAAKHNNFASSAAFNHSVSCK